MSVLSISVKWRGERKVNLGERGIFVYNRKEAGFVSYDEKRAPTFLPESPMAVPLRTYLDLKKALSCGDHPLPAVQRKPEGGRHEVHAEKKASDLCRTQGL